MSDIPPEVINDVLYLLPVKSLLRFRCVCKSWKSLIDSPKFIKAHLIRQKLVKPNSDFKLILQGDAIFSINFSSVCSGRNSKPQKLDHPLKHLDGLTQIVGSCNGLLLMRNIPNVIALWNPSTKMFRRLPFCDVLDPDGISVSQISGGFGYDGSSDDYKVVKTYRWKLFSDDSLLSVAMIYSLKLDMWKKVQGPPHWFKGKATLAGGVLHWIPGNEPLSEDHLVQSPLTLIGLNLGSERFQEVPCPENLGDVFPLNLAILGECLCLLTSYLTVPNHAEDNGLDHVGLDHVDIWVMKEYGVKESWIKLFSIEQLDGRQSFSNVKPISYSETGNEVLLEMDWNRLLWYNLEKKSLKTFKISCGLEPFETNVCLGTLVPLYGNGNNRKRNVEPDEETRAKNSDKGDDFLSKGFKLRL